MQPTGSSDSEDELRRGDMQDLRRRRSSPPDRHAGHRRQTPPEATAPTSQQEGHRKDESDTPEGKPTNKVQAATKTITHHRRRCHASHHAEPTPLATLHHRAAAAQPPGAAAPASTPARGSGAAAPASTTPDERAIQPIRHEPVAPRWLRKLQGDASNKVATRLSPPPAPDGA